MGLSGGVDSAVTAALLQKQGHAVIGLTMQVWDGSLPLKDEGRCGCYGPGEARDIEAARSVARRLGIPHHTVPLAAEYKAGVVDYFREEYLHGRTPNPCVRCNRRIKFGLLLERARGAGISFDAFATGHYAQVRRADPAGPYQLLRARDRAKDQSYFLSGLTQGQLAQVLFPLGELAKAEVKELARSLGWDDLAGKRESQDFFEGRDYSLLFRPEDARPGPIVDAAGRDVGTHRGILHYTVGQRKGLGIGGGTEKPLYVIRIDAAANTVVVGPYEALFARTLSAAGVNWIAGVPPEGPFRAAVKIRQQHREAPARVTPAAAAGECRAEVAFDEPQMSITPGQTVVFYQDDVVLGGGTIEGETGG